LFDNVTQRMLDKVLGDIEHFVTQLQLAAKDAADATKPEGKLTDLCVY